MLTAQDKLAMVQDIQSIHEDWFKTVTFKNGRVLTETDELGATLDSTELFGSSDDIKVILYTREHVEALNTFKRSKIFGEGGIDINFDYYMKVTKTNLGTVTLDAETIINFNEKDLYILEGVIEFENDFACKLIKNK